MFRDKARISVKAGDGGNGCVSFRREKYVPRGGPNGGDGGKGGDVVFVADKNLATLLDFYYQPQLKAQRGSHGRGKQQHGRNGADLVVRVPLGVIVRELPGGEQVDEFLLDGESRIVARGGGGGRGNTRFKSSTRRAPRVAEDGVSGEERLLELELKLIADVGLVGYPNAGKSTLISKISAAKPRIANYPFTTRAPHLGLVRYGDYSSFVAADIPGLIEGAHRNVGLGHEFLRHVERTRVLLIMLDMGEVDGHEPLETLRTLENELRLHRRELGDKPRLIAANKMDLPGADGRLAELRGAAPEYEGRIFAISALEGSGLNRLVGALGEALRKIEA